MKKLKKKDFKKAQVNIEITPGEMLRTIRELQELTQKDLSEITEISQSHISAMECGASQIGRERALKLAIALNTHPAVILFPDFNVANLAS